MSFIIYIIAALTGALLFLPRNAHSSFRNLPLLYIVLAVILGISLFKFLRYVFLMIKTKRYLRKKGYHLKSIKIIPFLFCGFGRYSMLFVSESEVINVLFMTRESKHLHYHFEAANKIELYIYTRSVYNRSKAYGPVISKKVDRNLLKKRKLLWRNEPKENITNIIMFDKLPLHITDTHSREGLFNGDCVCGSNVKIYEVERFISENLPRNADNIQ